VCGIAEKRDPPLQAPAADGIDGTAGRGILKNMNNQTIVVPLKTAEELRVTADAPFVVQADPTG
jgi:hypothetical protein